MIEIIVYSTACFAGSISDIEILKGEREDFISHKHAYKKNDKCFKDTGYSLHALELKVNKLVAVRNTKEIDKNNKGSHKRGKDPAIGFKEEGFEGIFSKDEIIEGKE